MANEIVIQATLTLQRFSPALQGIGDMSITQDGNKCVSNVVTAPTSSAAQATIQIEGTTAIAYLFVKNLSTLPWDDDEYVLMSLDTANPQVKIVAKLRAGEFCLTPPGASTVALYARAFGGAAIDICYVAAEL